MIALRRGLIGALTAATAISCAGGERPEREPDADAPLRIGFNDDFLGGIHGFTAEQKVRLVRRAGGTMLRTSLDWRRLEPARNRWDEREWATATELYTVALDHGVTPIFVIAFAPDWARAAAARCGPGSGPGPRPCELPPRRALDGEWADFAGEVGRRFPEAIVEVWNEPNLTRFWDSGPDPERYAELFVAAERAVEGASPETRVILAGLIEVKGSDLEGMPIGTFLRRMYRARPEIAERADAIGVHSYPGGADVGPGGIFAGILDEVRAIRAELASEQTPLYLTEVGVSTAGADAVTPEQQATTMTGLLRRVRAMPDVPVLIFHRLLSPTGTATGAWELGASWLLPGDYPPPPRPVYCAFAALAGENYPGC